MKKCAHCNKEFEYTDGRQRSCSPECKAKHIAQLENQRRRNKTIQKHKDNPKTCLICGKEFIPTRGDQKYCSDECLIIRRDTRVVKDTYIKNPRTETAVCEQCGNPYIKMNKRHTCCSSECYYKSQIKIKAERLAERYRQYRLANPRICKECGVTFIWTDPKQVYCGAECREKYNSRTLKFRVNRVKKLKANGEYDEDLTLTALRFRDKDICAICGNKVNAKDFEWRNGAFIGGRTYPTTDHIKPVSKGGTHTWNNVQLAHKHCNSIKNACDLYEIDGGQLKMSI